MTAGSSSLLGLAFGVLGRISLRSRDGGLAPPPLLLKLLFLPEVVSVNLSASEEWHILYLTGR